MTLQNHEASFIIQHLIMLNEWQAGGTYGVTLMDRGMIPIPEKDIMKFQHATKLIIFYFFDSPFNILELW